MVAIWISYLFLSITSLPLPVRKWSFVDVATQRVQRRQPHWQEEQLWKAETCATMSPPGIVDDEGLELMMLQSWVPLDLECISYRENISSLK